MRMMGMTRVVAWEKADAGARWWLGMMHPLAKDATQRWRKMQYVQSCHVKGAMCEELSLSILCNTVRVHQRIRKALQHSSHDSRPS